MQHTYLGKKAGRPIQLSMYFLALCLFLITSGSAWAADIKVEAESAALTGVSVATATQGYSGTGYVSGFDNSGDKLVFTVPATAGLYDLSIVYSAPSEKGYDLQVNAEKGGSMFSMSTTFTSAKAGKFFLKEGNNIITIGNGWGYFSIDYILLSPTTALLPLKPSKQLVDAKATASTKALFSYLIDQYGSKMISGQQNQDDMEYIFEKTGKEAAIGCFDLIEYSPSRVENGSNPAGTSEKNIVWAQKGEGRGIVSLLWHWNAPTDLINQAPDKLWWSGFYTRATTFDIAAVLADKNGAKYQLLLRDMDVIAAELKKFQAANIPVLWRPLHEAPGGWFWWGAKGSGPFKELWHILYDRLTNHHSLHNLIWVYTGTADMNWYPGDAYVDAIGLDIYTDASSNMSGDWVGIQEHFNGKKLVALSESGNLPDPAKVRNYGNWWSWFAVWTGNDYIRKQPLDVLKSVYTDEDVITRDELPDWRVYKSPAVLIASPTNSSQFYQCESAVLKANVSEEAGTVTKVTFKANGDVIGTDTDGQDGWQFAWTNATANTYAITAETTNSASGISVSPAITVVIKPNCNNVVLVSPSNASQFYQCESVILKADVTATGGLVTKVTFKANGSVIGTDTDAQGGWQISWTNATANTYAVTAETTTSEGKTWASPAISVVIKPNCFVLATDPEASGKAYAVYPHPVAGPVLHVNVHSEIRQPVDFLLINSLAQTVLSTRKQLEATTNSIQLPIGNVPAGVYVLIITKGKQQFSRRVVISK